MVRCDAFTFCSEIWRNTMPHHRCCQGLNIVCRNMRPTSKQSAESRPYPPNPLRINMLGTNHKPEPPALRSGDTIRHGPHHDQQVRICPSWIRIRVKVRSVAARLRRIPEPQLLRSSRVHLGAKIPLTRNPELSSLIAHRRGRLGFSTVVCHLC